jgi:hypothetical protein
MSEETKLATTEHFRQATDVAGVCKQIVLKTSMTISGRKFVRAEGWTSICTAHGCIASVRDVQELENGVRAIAEIRRMSDGACLSTAEGFVGKDEPTWFGGVIETRNGPRTMPKRPDYAIRAMASTRAVSRVCRAAFSHVVVLMDAGLSTTPAEEVPDGGFDHDNREPEQTAQPAARQPAQRAEPRNVTPAKDDAPASDAPQSSWRTVKIHFGKKQGVTLGQLESQGQIEWWLTEWQPREYQGKISTENLALRAALDAAQKELSGGGNAPTQDAPESQEQDSIPF